MGFVDGLSNAISISRSRIQRAWFLDRCTQWLFWGWLATGAVLLLGKLTLPSLVTTSLWATLGWSLVAIIIALTIAPRCSSTQAAAVLDRHRGLHGWPLLALSFPESGYDPRLSITPLTIHSGPYLRRLAPALLFLAIALVLPQQDLFPPPPKQNTAAAREVNRLTEKIEELAKTNTLAPDELDRLREELKTLDKQAEASSFGQEGWEGLDHLAEEMHRLAREKSAQLKETTAAARAMSAESPDSPDAAERRDALKKALEAMDLPPGLEQKLRDPAQFDQALKELQEFLDGKLEELAEAAEKDHPHEKGG